MREHGSDTTASGQKPFPTMLALEGDDLWFWHLPPLLLSGFRFRIIHIPVVGRLQAVFSQKMGFFILDGEGLEQEPIKVDWGRPRMTIRRALWKWERA